MREYVCNLIFNEFDKDKNYYVTNNVNSEYINQTLIVQLGFV